MAVPLLALPLSSDAVGRARTGAYTAPVTGPVRYQLGVVEEGTTNLFQNPLVSGGATFRFGDVAAGQTKVLITNDGPAGSTTCLEVAHATLTGYGVVFINIGNTGTDVNFPLSTSQPLTTQFWFKAPAAETFKLRVSIRNAANSALSNNDLDFVATGSWQYVSLVTTTANATVAWGYVYIAKVGGAGGSFRVGNIQVEQKYFATTFCPKYVGGILQPGYAWTGTPHASTSTRAAVYTSTLPAGEVVEEPTTNLFTNPRFVGQAPWGSDQTGTKTYNGDGSFSVPGVTTVAAILYNSSASGTPVTAGQTYTFSVFISSTNAKQFRLSARWKDAANTAIGGQVYSPQVVCGPQGAWVEFTGVAPALATSAFLIVYPAETGAGDVVVWWPQFENKTYRTSFVPRYAASGFPLPGHTWNGIPHASTSSRSLIGGALVEEGTTNLFQTPYAPNSNAYAYVTQTTQTVGWTHPRWKSEIATARRIVLASTPASNAYYGAAAVTTAQPIGTTFTTQFLVKARPGFVGRTLQYRMAERTGVNPPTNLGSTVDLVLTGELQYVEITRQTAVDTSDQIWLYGDIVNMATVPPTLGSYIDFSAIQTEQKAYATTFCPLYVGGVLQSGYTWSGTAHASTSTRAATNIDIPNAVAVNYIKPAKGSILFRCAEFKVQPGTHRPIRFGTVQVGTLSMATMFGTTNPVIQYLWYDGTANFSLVSIALPQPAGFVYLWWDGTNMGMTVYSLAGTVMYTASRADRTTMASTISGGLGIGGYGAQQSNTVTSDWFFYERPLTVTELATAITAMQSDTLTFTSLQPIMAKQGGVLKDAIGYKRKNGSLVDVNVRS